MKPKYGTAAWAGAALCATLVSVNTVAPAAWAQNDAARRPAASDSVESRVGIGSTYLTVRTLRDSGGLPTEGRDKKLNEQFTIGLRNYLSEAGKNRFDVDGSGDAEAARPPRNARILMVEGDLSRTEDGKGGGSFLAVLRLYQEKNGDTPRRLLAQWAGVADNYRYLTGNLDSRADIDKEGLLGEMGKRIAGAAAFSRGNAIFDAFIDKATQNKRVLATLVPDNGGEESGKPSIAAPVLRSGQGYRVRVASKDGGDVYVVRDEGDRLLPLLVPDGNDPFQYVDPGKPLLVPGNRREAWVAPRTDHAMEQTLIVLVRRDEAGAKRPEGAPSADDATKPAGTTLAHPTTSGFLLTSFVSGQPRGESAIASVSLADTAGLPVRVLSTGVGDPVDSGPVIGRLAGMMASDPDHTWTAQRLVVRVVPDHGH